MPTGGVDMNLNVGLKAEAHSLLPSYEGGVGLNGMVQQRKSMGQSVTGAQIQA